jgi:hypothetical protein
MILCFLSRSQVARRSCYACSRIFLLQFPSSLSRHILSLIPVLYFHCMVLLVWEFFFQHLSMSRRKLRWVSVLRHHRQRWPCVWATPWLSLRQGSCTLIPEEARQMSSAVTTPEVPLEQQQPQPQLERHRRPHRPAGCQRRLLILLLHQFPCLGKSSPTAHLSRHLISNNPRNIGQ